MRRAVEYAARAGVRRVLGRREYVEPSETRCYPASGWHPIKTVTGDPVQGELDGTGQVSGVEWKRRTDGVRGKCEGEAFLAGNGVARFSPGEKLINSPPLAVLTILNTSSGYLP